MNRQEADILKALMEKPFVNQRLLAQSCGHSVGVVNRCLKSLQAGGFLNDTMEPTPLAWAEARAHAPKSAVILAAGQGMRMVPVNTQYPKALLEIRGEVLIERTIRQLRAVGIQEIYVVVGFLKERFEYLIDDFGVELIVSGDYARKNNLHSLALAAKHLTNTYIIPCDIWCGENPFRPWELYSWYMVTDRQDPAAAVRVSRKLELLTGQRGGSQMVGIAYLTEPESGVIRSRLKEYDAQPRYDDCFWEETLTGGDRLLTQARVVSAEKYVEINTYEQLRELDENSGSLNSGAIAAIAGCLHVDKKEITGIEVLKKGMTNRSFLFSCGAGRYIMRIPGEGTGKLINRQQEAAVYEVLRGKGICDDVVLIDPQKGWKVTAFLENARVCDPESPEDLKKCMEALRRFHGMKLEVDHSFSIFDQIAFYESLWSGAPSVYRDYETTKARVLELRAYIDAQKKDWTLTHIDAVPDNFLFTADGQVRLIDWEYAGMQDPHVDIAMFCIYALYDREGVDRLIDLYFEGNCPRQTRIKIYCYIAACGLLWSNWCEYKRSLGVEFGEYSLRQYRYAKEYYRIVLEELSHEG